MEKYNVSRSGCLSKFHNGALATKSDTPTSPNIVPTMKNDSLYSTNLYSTLLFSTLLFSTLLYSSLLFSTSLYSTLLCSTILYSTLLFSAILYYSLSFLQLRNSEVSHPDFLWWHNASKYPAVTHLVPRMLPDQGYSKIFIFQSSAWVYEILHTLGST